MCSVCLIRQVLIMILWKHGRSMAHNLQFVSAGKQRTIQLLVTLWDITMCITKPLENWTQTDTSDSCDWEVWYPHNIILSESPSRSLSGKSLVHIITSFRKSTVRPRVKRTRWRRPSHSQAVYRLPDVAGCAFSLRNNPKKQNMSPGYHVGPFDPCWTE